MTNCEKYDRIHSHYNVTTNYYNNSYEKKKDSEIQKTLKIKPRIANKITKVNINICSFRFMRVIKKIHVPIFKYFGSPKIVPV
jgi:hypothetical protein